MMQILKERKNSTVRKLLYHREEPSTMENMWTTKQARHISLKLPIINGDHSVTIGKYRE